MDKVPTITSYRPKHLYPYITAFRVYRFDDASDVQLFPKGIFEMVFQSQHSFQHNTQYSTGWELRPRHFIGGLHNKAYHINPGEIQNYCIVAEFKPETAKYFIPEKLDAFKNAVIDIADIWGSDAKKLSQKIDKAKDDRSKIELIEQFLTNQFSAPKTSIIDKAIHAIKAQKGFIEITSLATATALSNAQFRKRFKEEVGIAPSEYCKIVRSNASMSLISNSHHTSLTDITYELGYFDQSHFIKDFKSITGIAPKSYQKMYSALAG